MSRNRSLVHRLSGFAFGLATMMAMSMTAVAKDNATSSKEYLDSLNVGVAAMGNASLPEGKDATSSKECLDTLNAGVTAVFASDVAKATFDEEYARGFLPDPSFGNGMAARRGNRSSVEQKEEASDLVMADVQNALNAGQRMNTYCLVKRRKVWRAK